MVFTCNTSFVRSRTTLEMSTLPRNSPSQLRDLMGAPQLDLHWFASFQHARDDIEANIHRPIIELYEEGVKGGDLKVIPYEMVFSLTYGTVSFLVNLHIDGQYDLSSDENMKCAVDSCWDAVKG